MDDWRIKFVGICEVFTVNGGTLAVIKLSDVKDMLAIVLTLVSIVSTIIIIKGNLRKQKKD